jgi:3-methyl-2-oxobutanoate hydroxymethyltransferase
MDEAGIDLILVGDSLGMVVQGHQSTIPVSMDEMLYHGKLTRRGVKNAFLAVDLPFGSCATVEDGLHNAIRIARETGADAVKIEGAHAVVLEIMEQLTYNGINVMGHIGLQPQMVNVEGGYKIQGKSAGEILLKEAKDVEKAGARLIVLEGMDSSIASAITAELSIPTIGIGAGCGCDGQVLVFHDAFGYTAEAFKPKFAKRFVNVGELIKKAGEQYVREVKERSFPDDAHSYNKD